MKHGLLWSWLSVKRGPWEAMDKIISGIHLTWGTFLVKILA